MVFTTSSDFYSLLQIPRDASPNDIKIAYHRTLLRLHPDKLPARLRHHNDMTPALVPADTTAADQSPLEGGDASSVDMALLKEAYRTLSDASLRAAYDESSRQEAHARSARGPRPAQVISLEEFTTAIGRGTVVEADADADASQEWRYGCRCGGMYRITEDDLENGTHLVSCESCSEVIWVGYEEAVTGDESEGF